MATPPSDVRADVAVVAGYASAELASVVAEADPTPTALRAAIFSVAPLIVDGYIDGTGALALDWYEELREEAAPPRRFAPRIVAEVNDRILSASLAEATRPLYELTVSDERFDDLGLTEATSAALKSAQLVVEDFTTDGFRQTVTGNTLVDPDAVGWRRFARPGACSFCLMLADRGAVYRKETANFAAHGAVMANGRKGGNCRCVAGPAFDPKAPTASAIQYLATRQTRTPAQRATLRAYLAKNYPDARG